MREQTSRCAKILVISFRWAVALFFAVCSLNAQNCISPPPDLISWWPGEGDAADAAGSNLGAVQSAAQFIIGEVGKAFAFNGVDQYVRIPNNASLIPSGSFSIEAWIYPTSGQDQDILSKWSNTERSYIFAVTSGNGLRFGISDLAHQGDSSFHLFDTPNNLVPLFGWSHVAAVYDQSTGKRLIYLNGLKVAERTDPPIAVLEASNDAAIGARQADPSTAVNFFAGGIDEVALYRRALSASEVASIYNAGSAGKCPASPAIVAQPQSQTIPAGDDLTLSVAVSGSGPFQYQWCFNGKALTGETNSSLTLPNVQFSTSGTYFAVATTANGSSVASENASVIVTNAAPCAPLPPNAVAWWTGDGMAVDVLGGNSGLPQNGASFEDGEVSGAFSFNGTNQYVRIPSDPRLVPSGSFSIEAWIYPVASGDQDILSKWSNTQRSYIFSLTPRNGLRFGISDLLHQDDSSFHLFDTPDNLVPLNRWSHVAAVYDQNAGRRTIYLNGIKVAERTDSPIVVLNATNDAAIGARQAELANAVDFFAGKIDEVSFYSRALSQAEVAAVYAARASGKCRDELPVFLQDATATFSQSWAGDFSAARAIDGVTDDNLGWGIYPNIQDQTAVFETKTNIGFPEGTDLTFRMLFNHHSTPGTTSHTLGRFRFSVTTDLRESFADGLQTGGDVAANWSVLDVLSATAVSGATLTVLPDDSILVSGALEESDLYTVVAATPLIGITGIRLEAMSDPSLPYGGPGREPLNGNFVLGELTVSARPGEGPVITDQPKSATIAIGESTAFSVSGTSSLPVNYQWFFNGAKIEGARGASLAVTNAQIGNAGTYSVTISNAQGTTTSAGAVLNVLPANAGNAAEVLVSNQTPTNAPISDLAGNSLAGPRFLAQVYAAGSDGAFRPASPAVPFLSGSDAGYFTPIDLLLPDTVPGASARVLIRVWDSTAGATYDEAVANGGQHGTTEVIETPTGGGGAVAPQLAGLTSFSLVAPPKIVSQPAAQAVFAGQNVLLQVQASGSAPLTYQWSFNSNEINGATSPLLSLTNVQVQNSGEYSVLVSNPLGSVASVPANLTVNIPDTNAPAIRINSPVEGVSYADRVTLSGTITDDYPVASATWQINQQAPASLALQSGQFSVPNILLTRGTNILQVTAADSSSNQSTASVTVVLEASRTLSVGTVAPYQEGARVTVPIMLASRGDVSGVTFNLGYDRNYLEAPDVTWDDSLQSAFVQINTNTPGTVRASFALSGITLPEGTQRVANVTFHARSIPNFRTVPLPLTISGIFSLTGDPLTTGTDVLGGSVQLTKRKYLGDNNANDRLDVGDASAIMRLVNQLAIARSWDVTANDLNSNSQLDIGDVIRVLRAVVGLDPQPGSGGQQALSFPIAPIGGPSLLLDSATQRAEAGSKIVVTANLSGFKGVLSGASFKLHYPAAALRFENASAYRAGTLVPPNAITLWNVSPTNDFANQDGNLSFAVSSDANWPTNAGTLAEFTFTVQDAVTNQYRWPIQVSDVELSSGFDLITVAGSEFSVTGREAIRPTLTPSLNLTNHTFSMTFSGEPGASYTVETSEDLVTWSTVEGGTSSDGTITVTGDILTTPHRFYRLRQD